MSSITDNPAMLRTAERVEHPRLAPGTTFVKWVTTTDHKVIGNLYFITSFVWFLLGGLMALFIRLELFEPGMQILDDKQQFNQLFTMHGTIMLLLFATPLFAGFANALMPLQIGAPDVAFPRLNMFAYWLYLFGGLIAAFGFLTPRVPRPSAGSPMPRCPTRSSARASVVTCGSLASPSVVSARSSVASTSSRRSCACVPPG